MVVPALLVAALCAGVISCGSSVAPGDLCEPGEVRCQENRSEVCADNGDSWVLQQNCSEGAFICVLGQGCLECTPNSRSCDGFDILRCSPDGNSQDRIATCDPLQGDLCFAGNCVNACELSAENKSYEGCEYWAVDLDNAVVADQGTAAAQQYSIVLSNASLLTAEVAVDIFCKADDAANPALLCTEGEVTTIAGPFMIAPGGLKIINLDPREVDGTSAPQLNDGPGTFRSMSAFRVTSSAPLIAYQFNPLENVNVFSNDASLLLPTAALADRYLAISWPQTLAITEDGLTNGGIHLRAFLTIVGTADDTEVVVDLSTDIIGGGGIGPALAGDTLFLNIDRYEVINLETGGFNADFTGTQVLAADPDKVIAVFTGSEASDSPFFDSFLERSCCADHLEQQLFPEVALGTRFVAVKTPSRTFYVDQAGWDVAIVPDEPEYWRVMATKEDTFVSTNLPAPNNTFFLQRGQHATFKSERDFLLSASHPVSFAQVPGSQQTTGIPSTLPGGLRPPGGDPSFILVPPIEQWRESYLFLVPNKYAFDFLLIAAPVTADILYDDLPLAVVIPDCEYEPIGFLETQDGPVEFQAIRCPLSSPIPGDEGIQDDGVHTLETTTGDRIGLIVWGWDSFVSYGYPGGANVALININ